MGIDVCEEVMGVFEEWKAAMESKGLTSQYGENEVNGNWECVRKTTMWLLR